MYTLSADGRQRVAAWLAEMSWPRPDLAEFHLKLVAAGAAGLADRSASWTGDGLVVAALTTIPAHLGARRTTAEISNPNSPDARADKGRSDHDLERHSSARQTDHDYGTELRIRNDEGEGVPERPAEPARQALPKCRSVTAPAEVAGSATSTVRDELAVSRQSLLGR